MAEKTELTPEEKQEIQRGQAQTRELMNRMRTRGALHNIPVDDLEPDEDFETKTMIIPREFVVTLKDHRQVKFPAGVHEVPVKVDGEFLAGDNDKNMHWYLRTHECKIYTKKVAAPKEDAENKKPNKKLSKNGGDK